MTLKERCTANEINGVIQKIRDGESYTELDETGNTCFSYLNIATATVTVETIPPEYKTMYALFKTREESDTDSVVTGNDWTERVHSCIVTRFLPSLSINVSHCAGQVFLEWCYCGYSSSLQRTPPFKIVTICIELMKCVDAKPAWEYIERSLVNLAVNLPDVSINILTEFQDPSMQEEHANVFRDVTKVLFANFKYCGGSDFIKQFPPEYVCQCLQQLL